MEGGPEGGRGRKSDRKPSKSVTEFDPPSPSAGTSLEGTSEPFERSTDRQLKQKWGT